MPRTSSPIGTPGGLPGAATDAPVDPGWQPWLELLEIALDAASDAAWAVVVPSPVERPAEAPLLHGAIVRLDARRAGKLTQRLARAAGIPAAGELDPGETIRAAMVRDDRAITGMAEQIGVSSDALAVVGQMAAMHYVNGSVATVRSAAPGRPWWKCGALSTSAGCGVGVAAPTGCCRFCAAHSVVSWIIIDSARCCPKAPSSIGASKRASTVMATSRP